MKERVRPSPKLKFADRVGMFVDRLVYAFSPAAGARRMAIRNLWRESEQTLMQSTFEGARNDDTRAEAWIGSRLSTDSALEEDLATLRSRSRELYRNDSIGGAIDGRTNLVVSYGFTPQSEIKERPGVVSADDAKRWNLEHEELFKRVAKKICKTGKRSLWQLCRLIENNHGSDGESLTILSDRGSADRPIPLVLEVVDVDRLETPPELAENKRIRLGIECDAEGKIVAYHIRDAHPGDTADVKTTYTRYPADRVLHVFESHFAQQSRGLPWLVRSLNRVKDGKDADEAAIIAQQVQACFAAFVTPAPGIPARIAADAAATGTSSKGHRLQEINPATIHYVDEGGEIKFATPSNGGANFGPFAEWNSRKIAAGMNHPYEMLVKNWTGLSFAGGRLSLTEARLSIRARQQLIIEMWLEEIWRRMVFEAVLCGATTIPPYLYHQAPWVFEAHSWTPPSWPFALTPGEEIDAHIKSIDNNLTTKAKVIAELGGDLEEVFEQRKRERAAERTMEIEPAASEVPSTEATPTPQSVQRLQELAA